MPIYEFECGVCGREFSELFMRASRSARAKCPGCGSGKTKRLFSTFGMRGGGGKSGGGSPSSGCSSCTATSCVDCEG